MSHIQVSAQLLPVKAPDVQLTLSYDAARILRDVTQNATSISEDREIKAVRELIFKHLIAALDTPQMLAR